jgi:hypothetical protein
LLFPFVCLGFLGFVKALHGKIFSAELVSSASVFEMTRVVLLEAPMSIVVSVLLSTELLVALTFLPKVIRRVSSRFSK